MLVESIQVFTNKLEMQLNLSTVDVQLISKLKERFKPKDPESDLSDEDIKVLKGCFATRCKVDTVLDCTQYTSEINMLWVDLARGLANFLKISYLTILIPTALNSIDYNNLQKLEQYGPRKLIISDRGDTLILKQGLYDRLEGNNRKLSTCTELDNSGPRALTVKELSRIKISRNRQGHFTAGSNQYTNLWDYLRKAVFVRLQAEGELPRSIWPKLNSLISQYQQLKIAKADFGLFKKEFNEFLEELYACKLENINHFYGVHINPDLDEYVLDVLIQIHQADNFTLDKEINELDQWLKTVERCPVPSPDKRKRTSSSPAQSQSSTLQEKEWLPILNCALSLLTVQFSYSLFSSTKVIEVWNQKNTVPSELFDYFEGLFKLISQNNLVEAVEFYKTQKQLLVKNRGAPGFLTYWFSGTGVYLDHWYDSFEKNSFAELNVQWHEPAILLKAALACKLKECSNQHLITFVEEIINTYSQKPSLVLKRFRVNCLYIKFLKQITDEDKMEFLNIVKQIHEKEAEDEFTRNIFNYVGKNLAKREKSTSLFKPFMIAPPSVPPTIVDIGGVLQYFKDTIHEHKSYPAHSHIELWDYLHALCKPVFTKEQRNEINVDERTLPSTELT